MLIFDAFRSKNGPFWNVLYGYFRNVRIHKWSNLWYGFSYISNIHLKDVIESQIDDYDVLNAENKPYNYCPLSSGKAFVDEVFKKSRELNFKGEYYLEGNNLREMEKVLSESSLYYFSNL